MLTFAILLAVISTLFELMIAAKIPVWRRASARSLLFNLCNSILLSYVIGITFGATGLISMTAGILSTMLSIPGYKFLEWMYDSPQAKQHGGNQLQYVVDKWRQVLVDFGNVIYRFLRFITAPIWIWRNLSTKLHLRKTQNAHK
jgi:hypothetical protein